LHRGGRRRFFVTGGPPPVRGDQRCDPMLHSLSALPVREVFPGFHGRFVHTPTASLVYWTIDAGAALPEHAHPHEQVVNMLDGEFELVVGGVAHVLRGGDVFVIPGEAPHSGRAVTEVRVLDVFTPAREDYRGLDAAPA
jgi:quercetin dioxygenase-like cupin family protein